MPGEVVKSSDLHPLEVRTPGADFSRRLSCEHHEGDLAWACEPGSYRIPGFLNHRVRLPSPGAVDDEGAVLLDQNRSPLLVVEAREGRIGSASFKEALVGGSAIRFAGRSAESVEAEDDDRVAELPPALQDCGEVFAGLLSFGVPKPSQHTEAGD